MAEIIPADAPGFAMTESLQSRHIAKMESEIMEASQEVMLAATMFADVDPSIEQPTEAFHERFGAKAEKMYRIARMANLPASEAPVGLKMAQQTLVGISKARATAKQAPRTLNMTLVHMPAASVQYKVRNQDSE